MDKVCIRERMISLSQEELSHATEHYRSFLAGSRLDPSEPIENDEQAQALFSAGLAEGFEQPIHDANDKLTRIGRIDFGPKDHVTEGAVVCVDGRHFIIGAATGKFTCEGTEIIGLSTEAPFYQAIADKEAGESCEFRGRTFTIREIF